MPPPPGEPVSVAIPVRDVGPKLDPAVRGWAAALAALGVGHELLVVDDGSTDGTADVADRLAADIPDLRVLRHPTPRGFGASLRTALAVARHPLFFYTAADYPYTPSDLAKLLARIAQVDPLLNRPLDVVSGCRTGLPTPPLAAVTGRLVRGFAAVALGMPLEPALGWHGYRRLARSWLAWAVFADPLCDPDSAFKLFRRPLLDRFPIQCDGDLVHVELVAKATFVTALVDELPLTPKPDPLPPTRWAEFRALFADPQFHPPEFDPAAVR